MKGELISCAHKDIYFLQTNTNSESTNLANLFATHNGREPIKYKSSTKLKHKFNPILEFFIQNKNDKSAAEDTNRSSTSSDTSKRRNSLELYEEAAAILGLTCSQTDGCRCIECQCHYFDFEEEIDFSPGNEYNSSCCIQ